ncbi:hypothetical protein NVP2117O_08 [Vibrio phage 2.117.O._10N.261.45.E9]|nr:hypothetical protein NVP1117O_08 [Vibrio phage 1.117.O._10N.261.45.E9]AUR95409.1 hypothetical protein NVP1207B_02 [Vibrio phage 1.207.B._10N.222.51.C2]AUS02300.1 hypothetical protein NVP2117O_08 [Vibrio phage 2.117.O._10N.261.45.E9]
MLKSNLRPSIKANSVLIQDILARKLPGYRMVANDLFQLNVMLVAYHMGRIEMHNGRDMSWERIENQACVVSDSFMNYLAEE